MKMRIAIASDDGKTIASHFGKTEGFVIYEVEDGRIKSRVYRGNTFTGHARGSESAGHEIDRHGPILAALRDCQTVVSGGMGMRIYNDLREAGIEVFVTDQSDIEKTLNLYLGGGLVDKPELGCDHKCE